MADTISDISTWAGFETPGQGDPDQEARELLAAMTGETALGEEKGTTSAPSDQKKEALGLDDIVASLKADPIKVEELQKLLAPPQPSPPQSSQTVSPPQQQQDPEKIKEYWGQRLAQDPVGALNEMIDLKQGTAVAPMATEQFLSGVKSHPLFAKAEPIFRQAISAMPPQAFAAQTAPQLLDMVWKTSLGHIVSSDLTQTLKTEGGTSKPPVRVGPQGGGAPAGGSTLPSASTELNSLERAMLAGPWGRYVTSDLIAASEEAHRKGLI